ncbi:diguanylate cyclase [Pseudomonas sp. NPDC008258]|uniref:sensor domain-containing diguanylate cyclase n=1 Tax=Pseudomonas sp. NPDC008258 TaxID=3364418 RepID=UPI0036E004E9
MPHAKHGLRLDLRTLILVLCALTALVMLCASYFASYRVQRQLLIDHSLEANRVYAAKLAAITETFIGNALQQLSFSAGVQGRQLADAQAMQAETDRVLGQSMAFNSTFVLDADGVLLAISPAPLSHLVLNVVGTSAPLALVGCLLLWWLAMTIARPLWQLAAGARSMDHAGTAERLHRVRAWYFEAAELKRALLFGLNLLQERIGRLNRDAQTDPLTGLGNRRSMELSLSLLEAEGRAFAATALDIDHFKRVNDNHGHDVGDQVLRKLAELMRRCCREGDLLCRTGGEEFLMLLPGASLEAAAVVGERLRVTVKDTPLEPVGAVTISLGVARWDGEAGAEPAQALG